MSVGLVVDATLIGIGAENLSPTGGGMPAWGLNDAGFSSGEGPLYATDPWDTFFINGFQVPGTCELRGVGAAHDYDSKKGKGSSGSRFTFNGYRPMPFELRVEIVTTAQWAALQDLMDLFFTKLPARVPSYRLAVVVGHPDLARLHIDRAILVGLPLSERGSIEGSRVFTFKFHEYYPTAPKNQTKTVSGAVPEDPRPPSSASLVNGPPPPPSSQASNLGTGGPVQGFMTPAGAQ